MADTLEAGKNISQQDLNISAKPDTNKDYFTVSIPTLKIDKTYAIQFQWVYTDGSTSEWSPSYVVSTPAESVPGSPSATVPTSNASYIPVTLSSFPANAKRVDVYIIGGSYGTGKVADSFLQAGTKSISVGAGTYQVSLITVSPSGINGSPSDTFTITITDPTANIQSPEASVTPSTPTVSSVLGAIQVSWNGKTSTGGNQPYGFDAAKVYIGTSSGFTPSGSNQVDILNFANGQNTLNIGVGTLVNGVALDYGTDYYVKIATTNGTDTSTAVSATGNPVRVGQVTSGDIVTIKADKIESGTLSAGSKITAGATGGKRVELSGTGDTPFAIYGTGGTKIFDYNATSDKLTIVGDGTFSGNISAASGTFTGDLGASGGNFTVRSGIVSALAGSIGGWSINSTVLRSSSLSTTVPRIELDPLTPQMLLVGTGGTISMSPQSGIIGPNVTIAGSSGPGFSLSPNGNAVLRGTIYADDGIFGGNINVSGNLNLTSGSLTTANSGFLAGKLRVNGQNAAFEFINNDGVVVGQMYSMLNGNEVIIQHGNTREASVGYPASTWYQTINPAGWQVGYLGPTGTPLSYLNLQGGSPTSGSPSLFTNASVTSGANTTAAGSYFRNISAGTGTQSTSASNNGNGYPAYIGDIYIQY